MVISLSAERSSNLSLSPRALFAAAILIVLSGFAKETASVLVDLPKPSLVRVFSSHSADTVVASPILTPRMKPVIPVVARVSRPSALTNIRTGMASWYGKVLQDHRTASGRLFNSSEMTAAHRTLPFGSKVRVTDLRNHRSIIVTITDRGVLAVGRVIDLSYGAAEQLGMIQTGIDPVHLEVLTSAQALLAENAPATQR